MCWYEERGIQIILQLESHLKVSLYLGSLRHLSPASLTQPGLGWLCQGTPGSASREGLWDIDPLGIPYSAPWGGLEALWVLWLQLDE